MVSITEASKQCDKVEMLKESMKSMTLLDLTVAVHSTDEIKEKIHSVEEQKFPMVPTNFELTGINYLTDLLRDAPKDKVIVGPDFDSIMCAIIMNKIYGAKVDGFFDTETLVIRKSVSPKECLFLDVEMLRKGYYSIGNHVNCVHKDCFNTAFYDKIAGCINANIVNKISGVHYSYPNKYPFGTVPLLLALIEKTGVNIFDYFDETLLKAVVAVADGTVNTIYNCRYNKNTSNWALNFFAGTQVLEKLIKPLFYLNSFEKRDLEALTYYEGRIKTKVNKAKYDTELENFIIHCHNVLDVAYQRESWYFGHNCRHTVFSTQATDTGKYKNMCLYATNSLMITSNIKSGNSMYYTIDSEGVLS